MSSGVFDGWGQDLKYAWRGLLQHPGFSALAMLTLALGLGATTAIFSVVYGVLLQPLPYPQPDRLMAVWEVTNRGNHARLADPNFDDFRDQNHTFQAMAKYSGRVASVAGLTRPTRTGVALVTRYFFEVLGVHPMMGRGFAPDDAHPGAAPVLLAHYTTSGPELERPRMGDWLSVAVDDATTLVLRVAFTGDNLAEIQADFGPDGMMHECLGSLQPGELCLVPVEDAAVALTPI